MVLLGFSCADNHFTCKNGECVKKNLKCDGDLACKDGSDEDDCECPSTMFQCQEGGCVPATAMCDGTYDCYSGDDEKNCRELPDPLLLNETHVFLSCYFSESLYACIDLYTMHLSIFVFQDIHAPLVTSALMDLVFRGQIHVVQHLSAGTEQTRRLCVVSKARTSSKTYDS